MGRILVGAILLAIGLGTLASAEASGGVIWIGGIILGAWLLLTGLFSAPQEATGSRRDTLPPPHLSAESAHLSWQKQRRVEQEQVLRRLAAADDRDYWARLFRAFEPSTRASERLLARPPEPTGHVAVQFDRLGTLYESARAQLRQLEPPRRFREVHGNYVDALQAQIRWCELMSDANARMDTRLRDQAAIESNAAAELLERARDYLASLPEWEGQVVAASTLPYRATSR